MNPKNEEICKKISDLYGSNPEFYKWVRDTADHFKDYAKMPDVKYTSLVMTIIATWEDRRSEFIEVKTTKNINSGGGGNKSICKPPRNTKEESRILDKTKEGGAYIF